MLSGRRLFDDELGGGFFYGEVGLSKSGDHERVSHSRVSFAMLVPAALISSRRLGSSGAMSHRPSGVRVMSKTALPNFQAQTRARSGG